MSITNHDGFKRSLTDSGLASGQCFILIAAVKAVEESLAGAVRCREGANPVPPQEPECMRIDPYGVKA